MNKASAYHGVSGETPLQNSKAGFYWARSIDDYGFPHIVWGGNAFRIDMICFIISLRVDEPIVLKQVVTCIWAIVYENLFILRMEAFSFRWLTGIRVLLITIR